MATSQFTIYSSNDYGAPVLNGLTGSLLAVLNACLVTGYGTGQYYKAPAGWLKPFGDVSPHLLGVPSIGGFTMPSGSKLSLFVNDGGYPSGATGQEASICGWEQLTNPSGSVVGTAPGNLSGSIGGGYGQFPHLNQVASAYCLAGGRLVWRKSNTATAYPRQWFVWADAHTFYIFMAAGALSATEWSGTNTYYCGHFGDIFSLRGTDDKYRCLLIGRALDNQGGTGNYGAYDSFDGVLCSNFGGSWNHNLTVSLPGHFFARNWGGGGGSSFIPGKTTDIAKMAGYNSSFYMPFAGILPVPNGPDVSYYLSPITLIDASTYAHRGRMRGMFHVLHPLANFCDGQTFYGSGDYAGKSFQIVKQGPNAGFWAMEISQTIETN